MSVADQRYPSLDAPTLGAVDWFACDMKRKLEDNAFKGNRDNWLRSDTRSLFDHAKKEIEEVNEALSYAIKISNGPTIQYQEWDYERAMKLLIDECADAANMLMMIADKAREHLRNLDRQRNREPRDTQP